MFTGIIKDIGVVKKITSNSEGKIFEIETKALASEIAIDDSVSTNGVCLTATKINNNVFTAQAVHVTLEKTNLGSLSVGDKVNLELALRPMDRMGGHFVQGHINGMARLSKINKRGNNYELSFSTERELFKYMIKEGSIAIDGISLTLSDLTDTSFTVSIIPHTFENTILNTKKIGDSANIEVDMMAKYLEKLLKFEKKDVNWNELLK